ncbi:MAG: hypothetical protein JNL98_02925 [Bryobacterales bacterium]|nr:hypothetical protein [Bryobacterales bacterium]
MSLSLTSLVVLCFSICLQAETLGVYLDKPLPAPAAASFRSELHNLLKGSAVSIELRSLGDRRAGESFDRLMVVHLRGVCALTEDPARPKSAEPLAYTHVEGDRILPYTEIFCDRMRQTVASVLEREPLFRRHVLAGRAIARILAHEIYHFLTQDKGHASEGAAKRCFSRSDLLTEHFAFDHRTRSRLVPDPEPAPVSVETEEATER